MRALASIAALLLCGQCLAYSHSDIVEAMDACSKKADDKKLECFMAVTRVVVAQHPPGQACKIKTWRYEKPGFGLMTIHGLTTCNKGRLRIKIFDGDEYFANDTTYFDAGAFEILITKATKGEPTIRYEIEEEN